LAGIPPLQSSSYGLELGSPTITLSRHGWGLDYIGAG